MNTIKVSLLVILFIVLSFYVNAQLKPLNQYGIKHIKFLYKTDTVNILVQNKLGEENIAKPLFLFCQGSGSQPLIKLEGNLMYGIYPFSTKAILAKYHVVIIGKPFVPLIMDKKNCGVDFSFLDSAGMENKNYTDRNNLSYYVNRNKAVLEYLGKQPNIKNNKLVVAGHSEGSTIVAQLATNYKKITHVIYAGGNPFGRIITMIGGARTVENDSTHYAENAFEFWEKIVANPNATDLTTGNSNKTTWEFSKLQINNLSNLKIPVLVTYGTKDDVRPFCDYFRVKTITEKKKNIYFKAYLNADHNFFTLKPDGKPDYENGFGWDKVAYYWLTWLDSH